MASARVAGLRSWPRTADVIVLPPDGQTVHVIDYKYGYTHVPADSPQLKIYGVAARQAFQREKVYLHVIQPRDYTSKPIRTHLAAPPFRSTTE